MEKEVKDIDIGQADLDAFVDTLRQPLLEPDEVTVSQLAKQADLPARKVRDRLNWLVDQGILVKRTVSNKKAYKPAEGKTWLDAKKEMEERYEE